MMTTENNTGVLTPEQVAEIRDGIDDLQFSQNDVEALCASHEALRAEVDRLKADAGQTKRLSAGMWKGGNKRLPIKHRKTQETPEQQQRRAVILSSLTGTNVEREGWLIDRVLELEEIKFRAQSVIARTFAQVKMLRGALDNGKHIVADMLHEVQYSNAELQLWITEAESALLGQCTLTPQPESSEDYVRRHRDEWPDYYAQPERQAGEQEVER